MVRWRTYQRERFPLVRHVPLVAATSLCVLAYSAHARGAPPLADPAAAVAASACALLFFWQLRVWDEFKDAADDARFRPYRPVPRGLVSLRELAVLGLAAGLVQLGLTLALRPGALPLLLLVWAYMFLMGKEFFVHAWLAARPLAYMLSHLLIVGLIQLFVSAWDWLPGAAPPALGWLVAASLAGGALLEIGRKLRAPADEEPGVTTYTAAWGRRRALGAWLLCALLGALAVAGGLGGAPLALALGAAAWLALAGVAHHFDLDPVPRRAKLLEPLSGLWVLGMYLALGLGRPA